MSDFERDLAEWLHRATPSAPRTLTMDDVVTERSAATRPVRPRRWAPLLAAAAVVLVLVAAVAVARSQRDAHRPPPAAPTTSHPSPTFTGPAVPPSDFASTRIIGSNGAAAWVLSDTLHISTDAGGHWHDLALPATLRASNISLINVDPDATVWAAVAHGSVIDLYRRAQADTTWSHHHLTAHKNAQNLSPDIFVMSFEAHGSLVAMTAGWGGPTPATVYSDLFLSTDAGNTFIQRPTGINQSITSTTFLDDRTALMVAGPDHNLLYRTPDAGLRWTKIPVPGANDTSVLGHPTATSAGIALTVVTDYPDNTQAARVLVSTDAGGSFQGQGSVLHAPHGVDFGDGITATLGHEVWIAGTGHIYQSGDLGRTWTDVATQQQLTLLTLASATTATAQASANCSTNLPDGCTLTNFLIGTSDAGHSWHAFQLP